MTNQRLHRIVVGIEFYLTSPDALRKAHERFSGSQGLLCRAAQGLAAAGEGHDGESQGKSGHDEIAALREFLTEAGLWIKAVAVENLHALNPMRSGREHRVACLPAEGRVLKDADAGALATESAFAYLTDLLLSNYYFDDDLQLLGGYEVADRLHLVTSQPYVDGTHPDWPELKQGLVRQGLRDPYPLGMVGAFIMDDDLLGEVDIYDLHVNNVIRDARGWLHPIDAHFYFDDQAARVAALQKLGLDALTGPTPLAASGLSRGNRA